MSRTLSELKQECQGNGIDFSYFKGADAFELSLQKYYWEQKNPGVPVPIQIDVMLGRDASKLTREEFSSIFNSTVGGLNRWVAELKINGCRGVLILEDGKPVRITSRRRSDVSFLYEEKQDNVPHLRDFNWVCKGFTVVDGELVHPMKSIITEEGTKTESQLQTVASMLNCGVEKALESQRKYGNVQFKVFDILWHNGRDVRNLSFAERRMLLEQFVRKNQVPEMTLVEQFHLGDVRDFYLLYEKIVKEGGEGIMLKEWQGIYNSNGRPKTMYKMKRFVIYDGFITGFVSGDKKGAYANLIGAFEFSAWIDGVETKIGAVSAIPLEMRKEATFHRADGGYQLKTEFLGRCAEIKGQEISKNGRLVYCQLVEWRPDKSPADCKILGSLYYGKS